MKGKNAECYVIDESHVNAMQWIPCSEDMPKEHESIFAKYKDTSKWVPGMFEKCSDDVLITIEYTDRSRKTSIGRTNDGHWEVPNMIRGKVVAWRPMPEPYKEGE